MTAENPAGLRTPCRQQTTTNENKRQQTMTAENRPTTNDNKRQQTTTENHCRNSDFGAEHIFCSVSAGCPQSVCSLSVVLRTTEFIDVGADTLPKTRYFLIPAADNSGGNRPAHHAFSMARGRRCLALRRSWPDTRVPSDCRLSAAVASSPPLRSELWELPRCPHRDNVSF